MEHALITLTAVSRRKDMRRWRVPIVFLALAAGCLSAHTRAISGEEEKQVAIDRHALVTRHNVVLTNADERLELQVGNGELAFGVDITGLQTFYGNTMSHWGWHTFPLPPQQWPEDFKLAEWDTYGRSVGYATSAKGQEKLYQWLRENPHR